MREVFKLIYALSASGCLLIEDAKCQRLPGEVLPLTSPFVYSAREPKEQQQKYVSYETPEEPWAAP